MSTVLRNSRFDDKRNRICATRQFFANFASGGLKTHKTGSVTKRNDIVVHILVSLTQGLCSNPVQLSKGHHMPLSGCGSWGSSPAQETAT